MSGRNGSTRRVVGFALVGVLALALSATAQPQPGSQSPGSPQVGPPGSPPLAPPGTQPDPVPTLPTVPTAPQPGQSEQPPGGPPVPQPGGGPVPGPGGQSGGFPGGPQGFSGPNTGFTQQMGGMPAPRRFSFKIDPKTPTKDLLPAAPKTERVAGPVTTDDLAKVPEVDFQARPAKGVPTDKLTEQTAHQLAKINHMNAKKTDAFMAALLETRPDLKGMPFVMGDDCRTSVERSKQFTIAANTVRQALGGGNQFQVLVANFSGAINGPGQVIPPQPVAQPAPPPVSVPQSFWQQFTTLCDQQDAARPKGDKALAEHVTLARIAALTQMLAPESAELRLGLVKYLTGVAHVEATKALANLAIFSPEDEVRLAAIDSLKVRREKDYTDIIVRGLRYPWPAVSKRSADAIARLGRTDLVPELLAVLEEGDPRLPSTKDVSGKKVAVVRELVKVNHHRNCIMCHAPGNPENVSGNIITAEVAIPGQPLPLPFEGYRQSSPDIMIRLDVTYLRQDFSAMLPVGEAHPWPDAQRFDFFVRERELEADEVAAYREKLTPKGAGVISPYRRAALAALRDITGKDTAPSAEAWRKLLDLPKTAAKPADGKVRD